MVVETRTETGTWRVKAGLAQMLKGGVIMDVVTAEQARIAEDAGAVAVMALERVPADIRKMPAESPVCRTPLRWPRLSTPSPFPSWLRRA